MRSNRQTARARLGQFRSHMLNPDSNAPSELKWKTKPFNSLQPRRAHPDHQVLGPKHLASLAPQSGE